MQDEEIVATVFLVVAVALMATVCFVLQRREDNRVITHVAKSESV
jgi:hypothetical protein